MYFFCLNVISMVVKVFVKGVLRVLEDCFNSVSSGAGILNETKIRARLITMRSQPNYSEAVLYLLLLLPSLLLLVLFLLMFLL